MYGVEQLTEYSFKNAELLAKINAEANYLIDHVMAPEGYKMALELEHKLKELASQQTAEPKIYGSYQYILIRLKFLSLLLWDDNTYFNLIKNYLAYILGSDIDINDRMTGKFYNVPDFVWPEISAQTIEALRQNNQAIGTQLLTIQGEQAQRPPMIKYWILDYDRTIGTERHENLERSQYFARSKNYQILKPEEKIKIQQLFEFYDGLKPLPVPPETRPEEASGPLIATPRQKLEGDAFRQEEEPYQFQPPDEQPLPPPATFAPPQVPPSAPRPAAYERSFRAAAQPPSQPPGALPIRPASSQPPAQTPSAPSQPDSYREKVSPQDLAGPQAPTKPAPRLNGNVINLKKLGEE